MSSGKTTEKERQRLRTLSSDFFGTNIDNQYDSFLPETQIHSIEIRELSGKEGEYHVYINGRRYTPFINFTPSKNEDIINYLLYSVYFYEHEPGFLVGDKTKTDNIDEELRKILIEREEQNNLEDREEINKKIYAYLEKKNEIYKNFLNNPTSVQDIFYRLKQQRKNGHGGKRRKTRRQNKRNRRCTRRVVRRGRR